MSQVLINRYLAQLDVQTATVAGIARLEAQHSEKGSLSHYKGFPICQATSSRDELRSDSSMGSVD